ncbi:MAG: diphosphatase [Acidimicrobiaceae bacterium]|jgi:NAD+ diphosphatase|nr:diphosphatase [Acidimicrobiaceae bacterium]
MTSAFVAGIEPPAELAGPALWFCVREAEILLRWEDDGLAIPAGDQLPELAPSGEPLHYLGLLEGRACWAVSVPGGTEPPNETEFRPLRALYGVVPDHVWTLAGRAVQIVEWDRTHQFCGRCGTPTQLVAGERAKRCPACALLAFPRLAPAVIVLIEREDEMLLARNRTFPVPMFSALAGFVEPGETLEEAVHREVGEEVGVEVTDLRYFASQPWPFPHSLMIGFLARWAGGDIRVDGMEIAEARWFRADDLPMIPPKMSIARSLIDSFLLRDH